MAPRTSRSRPGLSIALIGIIGIFSLLALILWLFDSPKAIMPSEMRFLAERGKIEKVTFVGSDRLQGEVKKDAMNSDEVREIGLTRRHFQSGLVKEGNEKLIELFVEKGVKYDRTDDPTAWM